MAQEIERKFLVDIGRLGTLSDGDEIRQGFIPTVGLTAVRVRISGAMAWLTLKGANTGATRAEFEYRIPLEDAQQMFDGLCASPILSKIRYRKQYGEHLWEIDVFEGDNAGLIVAEVELTSETDIPEIPDWVTEEVTGDPRYYNVNLRENPYSKWRDE